MIAYLEGSVLKKLDDSIIIKNQGIGYKVYLSKILNSEIEENDQISLFIHTAVSDDDIRLFGFQEIEGLKMFKLLISVSGVGPKTALEVMNNPLPSLKFAISTGDLSLLVNTKGIGKKTAERILIDLKGKIVFTEKPGEYVTYKDIDEDAVVALSNLGYRRHQILEKLKNMPKEINKTEDIIRYFLQNA